MLISIFLVVFGSVLLGAYLGILVYGSYWGFNNTLVKPSVSFSVDSATGQYFYLIVGVIGALILLVGFRNIAEKLGFGKPPI